MITVRNFTQENETASYLQQLAQQTVRYYASFYTCDIDDVDF